MVAPARVPPLRPWPRNENRTVVRPLTASSSREADEHSALVHVRGDAVHQHDGPGGLNSCRVDRAIKL